MSYPKLVIVGGGFAGMNVALQLKHAHLDITLIDKTNHHLFQPLLYQVASAGLAPRDIAFPIRSIFSKQKNTTVIMNHVEAINKDKKTVSLCDGDQVEFDYLVVATGSQHHYFGNDQWAEFAPGLKTMQDALAIRKKILTAYEQAETSDSHKEVEKLLTFVIVGGGPTGVEMAGAIAEIAHTTLSKDFRRIDTSKTRIILVEGAPQVLNVYPEKLGKTAQLYLEKLGVKVITGKHITDINADGVKIGDEFIETHNVIWAAGNKASSLVESLGIKLDRQGRVEVESDLTVPGYPEIFVIGDSAHIKGPDGNALPGIAPVAIQGGQYVGKVIHKEIPHEERSPFQYFDKGSLATIGKARAVGVIGKWALKGILAWFVWSFIHVAYLVGFRNRIIVMIEWSFWYMTGQRNSRLIYEPCHGKDHDMTSSCKKHD
jgi:NADH dehydrogenase